MTDLVLHIDEVRVRLGVEIGADTLTLNSCFNPSVRVSVTCIVVFFRVRRLANRPDMLSKWARGRMACAVGKANRKVPAGDSNFENFGAGTLNPARYSAGRGLRTTTGRDASA